MSKTAKYSAPALDKGLDILEYLSSATESCSQAEIAQGLGRSPNEIYRVLVVLEARGYIARDEVSGKYRLSLKIYTLSHAHSPVEQIRRAAHLPMTELSERFGLACYLTVPYEGKLMIVSQVRSPDPVSLSIREGTLFPLLNTTSGQVILANYPVEARKVLLDQDADFSAMSEPDKAALLERFDDIKQQGCYLAESQLTKGISNCSVFVGNEDIGLVAAVSVALLSASLEDAEQRDALLAAVRETAAIITERIGVG